MPSTEARRTGIADQKCAQNSLFAGSQLDAQKAAYRDMPAWHTDIAGIFMHIIHDNRNALPKNGLQNTDALNRPQMAKMFFNGWRGPGDGSQVENHFIDRLIGILTGNFGNKEESGILCGGHSSSGISNHLQQALQIKLGSKR